MVDIVPGPEEARIDPGGGGPGDGQQAGPVAPEDAGHKHKEGLLNLQLQGNLTGPQLELKVDAVVILHLEPLGELVVLDTLLQHGQRVLQVPCGLLGHELWSEGEDNHLDRLTDHGHDVGPEGVLLVGMEAILIGLIVF